MVDKAKTKEKNNKISKAANKVVKSPTYYYAIGRRREATARIRMYLASESEVKLGDQSYSKGTIIVNQRPIDKYFPGAIYQKYYLEPLRTTNNLNRFVITAKIVGGGLMGQLGAFTHGVARTLEKIDREKYRPILKKRDFFTRDPRAKQRRKAGYAQKARAKKQSPKR